MRVGFLAQENLPVPPHVPGASVSRVVHELARELASRDTAVAVASLEHPELPEGELEGVRYLRVPAGLDRRPHARYGAVARALRRADLPRRELQGMPFYARRYAGAGLARLAEHAPDVVHLQNLSHLVPPARRTHPRATVVLHMHCDWLRELPARAVRRRLEEVDLVVAVSDHVTGRIRDGHPWLADRCHTLHNGVRAEAFAPSDALREEAEALRARLGVGGGPVVLYVGTIAPEKGIDVLLRAFAQVRERVPEASLLLVGRHNRYFQVVAPRGRAARRAARLRQRGYPAEVERLARPLGDAFLRVDGAPHRELAAHYALADLFVMPSTGQEPFPLPVLEALASGLPVVATRRGGLPEAVRDGVDGTLVPAGDADALAGAVAGLCRDRALREELGARGRALVEAEFTWARQAERLLELYALAGAPLDAPAPAPVAV